MVLAPILNGRRDADRTRPHYTGSGRDHPAQARLLVMSAYFSALGHMAKEDSDLVAFLGDYFYEYRGNTAGVQRHYGLEIRTLDDYRRRYAQYNGDPNLQAAHAARPWIVVWDDHEVDNNHAGLVGENGMKSEEQMRTRRAAAH